MEFDDHAVTFLSRYRESLSGISERLMSHADVLPFPIGGGRSSDRYWSEDITKFECVEIEIGAIDATLQEGEHGAYLARHGHELNGFCTHINGRIGNEIKLLARSRAYELEPSLSPEQLYFLLSDVLIHKALKRRGLHKYLIAIRLFICLLVWNTSPERILWAGGPRIDKAKKFGFAELTPEMVSQSSFPDIIIQLIARGIESEAQNHSGLACFDKATWPMHMELISELAKGYFFLPKADNPDDRVVVQMGPILRQYIKYHFDLGHDLFRGAPSVRHSVS